MYSTSHCSRIPFLSVSDVYAVIFCSFVDQARKTWENKSDCAAVCNSPLPPQPLLTRPIKISKRTHTHTRTRPTKTYTKRHTTPPLHHCTNQPNLPTNQILPSLAQPAELKKKKKKVPLRMSLPFSLFPTIHPSFLLFLHYQEEK